MNLPVEQYYAHAFKMHESEMQACRFFAEWLPNTIIDVHAHCTPEECVNYIDSKALGHMLSTFPYFSLEMSQNLHNIFFPGKKISSLRFAKTFRGIDHRTNNSYLLQNSPMNDRVALFGLPEDVGYTNTMLSHPRVSALKMYWSYVVPSAKTIYEFFKPEVLDEAQRLDVPIVLHLPKPLAFSVSDLLNVIKDFPKLRIVLAHLGLSKMVAPGFEEAMKKVASFQNVFMDTALNPSAEIVTMAIKYFGYQRLMFGSDEPLNLIRSVAYKNPEKGERIVSDFPYHWVDPVEFKKYGYLAQNAQHSHWKSLLAIKVAVDTLPKCEQDDAKDWLFYKSAKSVYSF